MVGRGDLPDHDGLLVRDGLVFAGGHSSTQGSYGNEVRQSSCMDPNLFVYVISIVEHSAKLYLFN